jgi:predicted nucleic acid-binding protein
VVLDSQALWAVARNDGDDARAVLAASSEAGVPVLVPTAVLAETLLGDERDARANQVLKKLQIVPLTDSVARSAARLKRLAGMTGAAATIDAIVVATSAARYGRESFVLLAPSPRADEHLDG